jgi:hypothetical protein
MNAPVWDDRLISRARACALAAEWPLMFSSAPGVTVMQCGRCTLAVTTIPATVTVTHDGLVPAVLRHMVMQHGQALNTDVSRETEQPK